MISEILRVEKLNKFYGDLQALKDISFGIQPGEIIGLLGHNGAGKSTLIKCMMGAIKSYTGDIYISGSNIKNNHSVIVDNAGFLLEPSFCDYLSAQANLELLNSVASKTDEKKLTEVLETVSLKKFSGKKVGEFSFGMKQRLGLAQVLLTNPKLIVLDEPTVGLDPLGVEIVKNIIDLENNITKFINMFNNSKNIYDINEVRDYYKEKIYNQINEITNTSKKEELENKIKDIVNIINDYDKPIISGVENNKHYEKVEIDVFDDSNVTIKVLYNGEEIDYKNSYSNVGVYEIFVRDEAFNEEYLTFTIENSAPKFLNILNGHRYNEIIVSVDDDNLDRINVFYYEDRTNTIIPNNTKLEGDGTYRITAYDKSGNSTKIYVALDTEVSDITVTKSNNDQATIDDVTVTISSSENIYVAGFSKVDEQTFQKTYSENGTYSVEVKDTCGNTKVVTFEVKNINKNNITLKVIEPNKYYIEQGSKYIDKGYYAYDLDGNDITDQVNISYLFQASGSNEWKYVDELDTNKLGVYKLTYTVSDNLGNTAKATRVVAIKEKSSLFNITNFFTKLF